VATRTNRDRGNGYMKKNFAGLAMATIVSVAGMPAALAEGKEPGGPHCAVLKGLPPQLPVNPGCGHGE
jgi:hypothetical protein